MKFTIDFIEKKDVTQTIIYPFLKSSKEEAQMLQYLCKRYITGYEDTTVLNLLEEAISGKYEIYLKKLDLIKNLLDLGWIKNKSGALNNSFENETLVLELLQASITPSITLLYLLENGSLDKKIGDITPYNDHLEYLNEQFEKINIIQKISQIEEENNEKERLKNRVEFIEDNIKRKLEVTTMDIYVEELFREKKLNDKEQLIFFTLLKEEYSYGDDSYRDINFLMSMISADKYETIKNRSLLEDSSKLITEEIIDYEELFNMFGDFGRSFFIKDEIIQKVMHSKSKKTKQKLETIIEKQELFEYLKPTTTLDDVVLHPSTRETLDSVVKQLDKDVAKKLKLWGIKEKAKGIDARLIFYGVAGTGKTMTAISLAKTLKKPILSFDCSKILSMYVGESEKNVRKIFDDFKDLSYKAKVEPILLLNEADQFLSARTQGAEGSADKMHNQMQNIFLEQIERFEGVLIATTNLLENIDKAFSRRFNYKVEFKKPNKSQRLRLWQGMLPQNADYEESFETNKLTPYELTGGQINLIIKNTAYKVAIKKESLFTIKDFLEEIEKELGSNFDTQKSMGFKG